MGGPRRNQWKDCQRRGKEALIQGDLTRAATELTQALRSAEQAQTAPLDMARLRTAMGHLYLARGEPDSAADHLARAVATFRAELGPEDPVAQETTLLWALCLRQAGEETQARPILEQLIRDGTRPDQPPSPQVAVAQYHLAAASLNERGADALADLEQAAQALEAAGAFPLDLVACLNDLAGSTALLQGPETALPIYERALAAADQHLGLHHPIKLSLLDNLAGALHSAGQVQAAMDTYDQAIGLADQQPETQAKGAALRRNLAVLQYAVGKLAPAEALLSEALSTLEALGPGAALDTAMVRADRAGIALSRGQARAAQTDYEQALAVMTEQLSPDDPRLVPVLVGLGSIFLYGPEQTSPTEALPFLRRALGLVVAQAGETHPQVAVILTHLANVRLRTDQPQEACALLGRAVEILKAVDPGDGTLGSVLCQLGRASQQAGAPESARDYLRQGVAVLESQLGPSHPVTVAAAAELDPSGPPTR